VNLNILITGAGMLISLAFAALVLRQYVERKKMHQLIWGIALVLWTIGVGAELSATLNGWSAPAYRMYYATGALLIPAWLGMGTLFLVFQQRWVNWVLVGLGVLSLLGVILIAVWQIEPAALQTTPDRFLPLRVFPFFPVQLVLIVLNTFGTIAFVGGALWSAWKFAQMRTQGERVVATGLIALGGIVAAIAHSLGVLAGIELFRLSELLAVILIFVGFLLTMPATDRRAAPAPDAPSPR
jgi:hypothetical protein